MNWSAKRNLALLLALAGLFACSREHNAKALAGRLREADRVTMVEKRTPAGAFTMKLAPEDINRLVQAVSTAKEESPLVTAVPELRIESFKGTNLLVGFDVGVRVFWIDHSLAPRSGRQRVTPYSDNTGTLESLGQKFREAKAAAQTATNNPAR